MSLRSGHSKAKASGPDFSAPVVISEDEFELVVAVFERITHDKTEYLHHALENGMYFPRLRITRTPSLLHFLRPRPPIPSHHPGSPPPSISYALRGLCTHIGVNGVSKLEVKGLYPPSTYAIFPSTFRRSHTSIPRHDRYQEQLYICFRRKSKAVSKTRASHITLSDKLILLQNELATAFKIANEAIGRETLTKDAARLQQEGLGSMYHLF
jgi:enhancer of polycomb-like protein